MKYQGGMPEAVRLICWTCVCLIWCYGCEGQINPSTTLGCHLREYTFEVNKDMISEETGDYLYCSDKVTVYSCWGRCDSYEFGDYKIPYKVSYHPVCTYSSKRSRLVRLRRCHPDHPEPIHEVFDAVSCSCTLCNSEHTSCENLNG